MIALGGIPNKAQVGDMGIDGRIYPVSSMPAKSGKAAGELDFMDIWYPIQVKQKRSHYHIIEGWVSVYYGVN